ncbi:hypothetical protein DOT_0806 [Desulfosporosinus sp. OT]|nr:hypothetical protein DOT_0806 [Desulfosporosinus sp. OT]
MFQKFLSRNGKVLDIVIALLNVGSIRQLHSSITVPWV